MIYNDNETSRRGQKFHSYIAIYDESAGGSLSRFLIFLISLIVDIAIDVIGSLHQQFEILEVWYQLLKLILKYEPKHQ